VVNAVGWAASRPWSTGKVGMYGKSYDALTGLIGVDKRPAGLAAVVAQEPVYDDYRYLYGDGMRRENSTATPALYDGIAATPGPLTDSPNYNVASLNNPACLALNFAAQASDDNHVSRWISPLVVGVSKDRGRFVAEVHGERFEKSVTLTTQATVLKLQGQPPRARGHRLGRVDHGLVRVPPRGRAGVGQLGRLHRRAGDNLLRLHASAAWRRHHHRCHASAGPGQAQDCLIETGAGPQPATT
jgi:hypothetical protein